MTFNKSNNITPIIDKITGVWKENPDVLYYIEKTSNENFIIRTMSNTTYYKFKLESDTDTQTIFIPFEKYTFTTQYIVTAINSLNDDNFKLRYYKLSDKLEKIQINKDKYQFREKLFDWREFCYLKKKHQKFYIIF